MRVLINLKGVTKILLELESYNQLVFFIQQNFSELPTKWALNYIDSHMDVIFIRNQKDLESMLNKTRAKYIKMTIVQDQPDSLDEENLLQEFSMIKIDEDQKIAQRRNSGYSSNNIQTERQSPIKCKDHEDTKIITNPYYNEQEFNHKINQIINQRVAIIIPSVKDILKKQIQTYSHDKKQESKKLQNIDKQPKCKHKCAYQKGDKILQDKNINLLITQKCFKMSKVLGGNPEQYRNFVEENYKERTKVLLKMYIQKYYGQKKESKIGKLNEKQLRRVKKLSFYYRQQQDNFVSVVRNNPQKNFYELVNIIEETPTPKKINHDTKQSVVKIPPLQTGLINKIKYETPQSLSCRNISSRRESNVSKKAQFLIKCKEMFGNQNSLDYLNFFNLNKTLNQQELLQKWINQKI